MSSLRFENVSKTYPGPGKTTIPAITGLSLEIHDRELTVLLGPSGSGKSTLLRMIAGLETPTQGDILMDGRRINHLPPRDRDIAMVFQNSALYPHMTVFQNMAFGLHLRRRPKAEITRLVHEAAATLGLETCLDRHPATLSGGQRQRVALGRAIVRQPKIFLLDEPLSSLDPALRAQLRTDLTRLHQRLRTTMIYVTHDQTEAMTLGQRLVALHSGAVQQHDIPLALYNTPASLLVAGLLGAPPMNLVRGHIREDNTGAPLFIENSPGTLKIPLPQHPQARQAKDLEIILGLRPEHIALLPPGSPPAPGAFPAILDIIEPLGPETLCHAHTGAHTLICRAPLQASRADEGHRRLLRPDPAHAHLFDPLSGLRLA